MSVTITAGDVNKLRQITGAGMMDCKKALGETGGDFEAAIDYLRKKGQKVSEKRADRRVHPDDAPVLAKGEGTLDYRWQLEDPGGEGGVVVLTGACLPRCGRC